MLTQRFEHFADRLNPMVIKELRQAVRGNAVMGIVYAFLAVQVFVFGFESMQIDASDFNAAAGQDLFLTIAAVMLLTLLVAVPVYAGVRVHIERVTEHLTMVQLTGMGFRKIFWGKFWSAMMVDLLILSTMLPFAFAAVLLRGIDLPTILMVAIITTICSAVCVIGMLAVGCLMVGPVSRVIWGIVCLIAIGMMVGFNLGMNAATIYGGFLSVFGWIACPGGGFLIIAGITLLVLYQSAKHRLTGLGDAYHLRHLEYQPWYVKMQTGQHE